MMRDQSSNGSSWVWANLPMPALLTTTDGLPRSFAAASIAVGRDLGLEPAKVNVHGGAVALGHPIGATGARLLVTLIHALQDRGGTRGLAGLCLGGGNAVALAIELV